MAARYLADHRLSSDEIYSLLGVREVGGPGGIAPQLAEVAAWTAAMVPTFFETLLEREPDVLLRSQAAALEPDDRARLATAILQRLGTGELVEQYGRLLPLLGQLNHPGLDKQLQLVIENSAAGPFVRRAAIDIATAAGAVSLSPTLVRVAADRTADAILRTTAVYAAKRLSGTEAASSLCPILKSDLAGDDEDRLRGSLLTACWPDHLSFEGLLAALTVPKTTNFLGPYQLFLYRIEVLQLTATEAEAAAEWLLLRLDIDDDHDRLRKVTSRIFWAATKHIDVPEVRAALASFVNAADHKLGQIVAAEAVPADRWVDDVASRAAFIVAVLKGGRSPFRSSANVRFHLPGLLRLEDVSTLLAKFPLDETDDVRSAFGQIILDLIQFEPIDSLDEVWEAATSNATLQRLLIERYSVEIDSVAAETMRGQAKYQQERDAERDEELEATSSWSQGVAKLLDRIEAGEAELWWELNLQLFFEPGSGYNGQLEFTADLRTTPGWRSLGEDDRKRLIDSAFTYLSDAPLTNASWLGTNTSHRPANAGVRAILLIREELPDRFAELNPATWAAWAPALIGFFSNDFHAEGRVQVELVSEAFRHAPDAVLAAVRQVAVGDNSEGLSLRAFELLEGIDDGRLADTLRELRVSPDLKGETAASDILKFLIKIGDAPSIAFVRDGLAGTGAAKKSGDKASLAAAAIELLIQDPRTAWQSLLELRDRNADLARSIWRKVANDVSFDRAPDFSVLSEYELAQAYIDLDGLLPERPKSTTGARVLGVPDFVEQLRVTLLSVLVEAGTNAGLQQLHRIDEALPDRRNSLRWSIEEARRIVRAKVKQREDPAEILAKIAEMGSALAESGNVLPPKGGPTADDTDLVPIEADFPLPAPEPEGPLADGDRRIILAVATEWTSHHGGVSTLNRELCGALAKLGHTVLCLVPSASQAEIQDAKAHKVDLVAAKESPGLSDPERLLLCQLEDLGTAPEFVIGHDQVTGRYARALASRFSAKYVHFLHTIPRENEGQKIPRDGRTRDLLAPEIKTKRQVEMGESSDLVVAVGPRIKNHFEYEAVNPPTVTMLLPGLSQKLLSVSVDPGTLTIIACLMSGRMEDASAKGALIACNALKLVVSGSVWSSGKTPELIIRGFSENIEAEFKQIGNYELYKQFLRLRSFSTNPSELLNDYKKAALIIMPSLAEGFGLTGLEAIAAGVPVVLSRESGLAQYLEDPKLNNGLSSELIAPCLADVVLEDAANHLEWQQKIEAILKDLAGAFDRAAKIRTALKTRLTWDKAARKLTVDMLGLE